MIELTQQTADGDNANLLTVILTGPRGRLLLKDILWIVDEQSVLETYYWQAWATTQGAYHCCWSWPGKVTLLPPQ
jgi:hypothetical protein